MTDPLATEKTYLREHQDELKAVHLSRYLLIKGEAVHGAFETYEQGVVAGTQKFGAGPFLVRSAAHPEDAEVLHIPALSLGILSIANP